MQLSAAHHDESADSLLRRRTDFGGEDECGYLRLELEWITGSYHAFSEVGSLVYLDKPRMVGVLIDNINLPR